jgi:hypothetical protein
MTQLVETLRALELHGKVELNGRWVTLDGERCAVYVVEERGGTGYYSWCADAQARTVEWYRDPVTAIERGLRRAAKQQHGEDDDGKDPQQPPDRAA